MISCALRGAYRLVIEVEVEGSMWNKRIMMLTALDGWKVRAIE